MITKNEIKIIKSWAKLRHPDKKFANTAIGLYGTLQPHEQKAMIKEFKDYVDQVRSGIIEPSPVELHIPKYGKPSTH